MSALPPYPWRFKFSDGPAFQLPDSDRDRMLSLLREAASSSEDEPEIELYGKSMEFWDHVAGNQDGDRIKAVLKAAFPDHWRRYNLSMGTLRVKRRFGVTLAKLDRVGWKPEKIPGSELTGIHPCNVSGFLKQGHSFDYPLRTTRFAHPAALREGDILATGDYVLSGPRDGGDVNSILLHLPGGFEGYWVKVPYRISIPLLVEGDEEYEVLHRLALHYRDQFLENMR